MGLAALYAVAWQFCFVLPPRLLADMSKQPLLPSIQWLRSLSQMQHSLAQS